MSRHRVRRPAAAAALLLLLGGLFAGAVGEENTCVMPSGACVDSDDAAGGAGGLAVLRDWAEALGPDRPSTFGAIPVVGAVRRMAWDHDDPEFNRKLMERLTPVVVTGSPVEQWAAVGKWTPDYVADVVGRDALMYATHSADGNFLFHSESKAKTADPSYHPPNKYFFMKVGDFVRIIQRNHTARGTRKRLYYKIQQKAGTNFYKLEGELQPRSMLCFEGDCARTRLHIWFGAGGVRSQPHYDISQNFFAQIFGEKTFYIAPPGDVDNFEMLPGGHPSARHCGLDWPVGQPDVVARTDLRFVRADLHPGDLLVLPSLWLHTTEVEGDAPSLGFSMWNAGFSVWRSRVRDEAMRACDSTRRRLAAAAASAASSSAGARGEEAVAAAAPSRQSLGAAVWREARALAAQVYPSAEAAAHAEAKFLRRFRPEVCGVIGRDDFYDGGASGGSGSGGDSDGDGNGDDASTFGTAAAGLAEPAELECVTAARALVRDDRWLVQLMERDVLDHPDYGGRAVLVWEHVEGLAQGLLGERGACEYFDGLRRRQESATENV